MRDAIRSTGSRARVLAVVALAGAALLALLVWSPSDATHGTSLDGVSRLVLLLVAGGALLAFALVVRLVRAVLARAGAAGELARLLLVEAMRERSAVLVTGLLLLFLGTLPMLLDPSIPLRYRVRNYLSYGQLVLAVVLGGYVIALACGSVAADLERGRAIEVFAKPVRFASYVAGKCLGIAVLVAASLASCGAVVYTASALILPRAGALDAADAAAVRDEVLAARRLVAPVSPVAFETIAGEQLERLARENPTWIAEHGGQRAVERELIEQVRMAWRSMGPGGVRTYLFAGLSAARERQEALQLRLRVETAHAPAGGNLALELTAGGRRLPLAVRAGVSQTFDLPSSLVDDAGQLELIVRSPRAAPADGTPVHGSIVLPERGGLAVLYPEGSFGPNLARAFCVRWAELTFLGALGVCGATFLSFPVATLLSLAVWLAAATSSLVLEYAAAAPVHTHGGASGRGFPETLVAPLTEALARFLREFSRIDLGTHLTEGLFLPWGTLFRHTVWIGGGWGGACALLAWAILRRREIARARTSP